MKELLNKIEEKFLEAEKAVKEERNQTSYHYLLGRANTLKEIKEMIINDYLKENG